MRGSIFLERSLGNNCPAILGSFEERRLRRPVFRASVEKRLRSFEVVLKASNHSNCPKLRGATAPIKRYRRHATSRRNRPQNSKLPARDLLRFMRRLGKFTTSRRLATMYLKRRATFYTFLSKRSSTARGYPRPLRCLPSRLHRE